MVNITFSMFFDRKHVIDKIGQARTRGLSRAGAFSRQVMRRLFRSRKKSSLPGTPPSSHLGLLRQLTYFGFDGVDSVVTGPTFRKGNPPVPQLLNEGGRTKHWKTGKLVLYRAFPFVEPTRDIVAEKFPSMFSNSVR